MNQQKRSIIAILLILIFIALSYQKNMTKAKAIEITRTWSIFMLFLIINTVQSIYTPLLNDESYYWLYAQNLSTGYLDHPPLIAWCIKLGLLIFDSEIGVRLFAMFAGSLTPLVIYKIIKTENKGQVNVRLFILLMFSSVFLNLYAFLAIPDTLLLFFTAVFFLQYQQFLSTPNYKNAILTGIVCALLLYSKYHGILIIGLTIMSNPRVLKQKAFYIATVIALLLFVPHIIWQINNDFASLRFHLLEKGNHFDIKHVFSYIGEQLLVTGPVVLLLFTIRQKTHNKFLYTLKFVSIGVFLFFFISSFRGMVNAYWTLIAWPGMIILSYLYIENLKHSKLLINGVLFCGTLLVVFMRISFLFGIIQIPHFNKHNPKQMAQQLADTISYDAVFLNMFIDAATYNFYSQKPAYAINNSQYKKTQYNYLNQSEKQIQGKTVTLISYNKINDTSREINIINGKKYFLTTINQFRSFQTGWKVKSNLPDQCKTGQKLVLPITVENKNPECKKPSNFYILLTFYNPQTEFAHTEYRYYEKFPEKFNDFEVNTPLNPGIYKTHFTISPDTSLTMRTFNSNIWHIQVKDSPPT